MQFLCNQDTFSKYLNVLSRIVSSKPGLPILSNVLFEASNGKVSMTATDLEIGLHCWFGAEVKSEGKIAVPAKQLAEFINSIPSEKIEANLDGQMFAINTVNNFAQFNTSVPDDYPAIATVSEEKPLLRISKSDIIEAVSKVAFAAAKDDVKPVLTGIKIEISGDTMAFVAADGLRLSRLLVKLSSPVKESVELLVPAKALEELAHVVSEFSGEEDEEFVDVYMIAEKNQVLFRYNDVDLVSRLIDGHFPDYKVIIPTSHQTKFDFDRAQFQNAFKVTNIIARNVVSNKMLLNIDIDGNLVTLSAVQSEIGNNKSSFAVKAEGNATQMAFSGKFLGDMLNNISENELVFECSTPIAPGVVKISGNDNFIHLIMPMRL